MNSNSLSLIILLAEDEDIEENYENTNYKSDEELSAAEQVLNKFKRNRRVCIRNYDKVSCSSKL